MNNTQKQILFTLAFFIFIGICVCIIFIGSGSFSSSDSTTVSNPMTDMVIGSVEGQGNSSSPVEAVAQETESETETETPETETMDADQTYYSFVTINRKEILHVRREPSIEAEVIARLAPGTTGYVLEHGSAWSLISTGTVKGYAFNEYLDLTQISQEDIPADYR